MKIKHVFALLGPVILCVSCDMGLKSGHGFSLPEGNADKGKVVFISKSCLSCHSIKGLEKERDAIEAQMDITLGGETTRIATYGELVTSIINPSHRLSAHYRQDVVAVNGVSKMRNYNDALTVTELSDLVAYVQAQYKVKKYPQTTYPPYSYPSLP